MGGMSPSGNLMLGSPPAKAPSGPGPYGMEGPPPSGSSATRPVRWGPAIAYGVFAMLGGGVLWGIFTVVTGYVFSLVASVIGLLIAWAMDKGARGASNELIAVAVCFTILAIFIGDIVALSIVIAPYGLGPADAIALYPTFVAQRPGPVALAYVFGVFGAVAAARYLLREMHRQQALPPPMTFRVGAPPSGMPTVRVLQHTLFRVAVEVSVPGPDPHTVTADLSNLAGGTTVELDGRPFLKTRVFMTKNVDVPLPGDPPRVVSFYLSTVGPRPKMDVFFNRMPVSRA